MTSTAPSTKRLERSTPSETAIRWPTTELLLRLVDRSSSDPIRQRPRADCGQKQDPGGRSDSRGIDSKGPVTEAHKRKMWVTVSRRVPCELCAGVSSLYCGYTRPSQNAQLCNLNL